MRNKNINIWFLDSEIRFSTAINLSNSFSVCNTRGAAFVKIEESAKDVSLSYFQMARKICKYRYKVDTPICLSCSNLCSDNFELDGCNHKRLYSEHMDKISKLAAESFIADLLESAGQSEEEVMNIIQKTNYNMKNYKLSYILNADELGYDVNQEMYPCGPIYSET